MVQIHKQTWKVLQEHAEMCVVVVVFVCWILSILVQITADEEQYW